MSGNGEEGGLGGENYKNHKNRIFFGQSMHNLRMDDVSKNQSLISSRRKDMGGGGSHF